MLCEIGKNDLSVPAFLFQCVNSYLVKAAVSVCHRFYTIYQTPLSILKCFGHACNGVFISTIKNVVSDMLLSASCALKGCFNLNKTETTVTCILLGLRICPHSS